MSKSNGWTICIKPNATSPSYKITKIVPLADGGFSVLTPYHSANVGHLFKMPVDPTKIGRYSVSKSECINFHAGDKVKLSYHPDGFAQFSGQQNSTITSGIDPITKLPRGVGLFTRPLSQPISSGPSVGIIVWGLGHFDLSTSATNNIIMNGDDFYFRDCDESSSNAWNIAIYALPKTSVPATKVRNGRKYFLANTECMNGSIYCMVEMLFLELSENSPINLAVYGNRMKTDFKTESGWIINGPGDWSLERKGHVLMARYPLNVGEELDAQSVDRRADGSSGALKK